ncbi:polysaccharide deacetylase family protein [Streptomyces albidoflavus]
MGQVRQNEQSGGRRLHPGGLLRRTRAARLVAAGLTAAALLSGCALGTESGSGGPGTTGQAGPAPETKAQRLAKKQAAIAAATRRWGLAQVPLTAPAPPDAKPALSTRDGFEVEGQENLPHVFTTVPVKERVVFLTIDDGAEKDPEFLRMMKELDIPYSAFLSDYLVSEDYDYFRTMQKQGTALHNHTLDHPYLPGLSYEEQRHQICGMQDIIEKQYGKRPRLFRPPYGNYNQDTLKAAKSCGIEAVPLWNAEAFIDRVDYREWDRDLHPGDIVLTHFRGTGQWDGTMVDMVRQAMKVITSKGYAVARLEDYI